MIFDVGVQSYWNINLVISFHNISYKNNTNVPSNSINNINIPDFSVENVYQNKDSSSGSTYDTEDELSDHTLENMM